MDTKKSDKARLDEFLQSKRGLYNCPFDLKERLKGKEREAVEKLKSEIPNIESFETLKNLSAELLMPATLQTRSKQQAPKKNNVYGPFEVWWEGLYFNAKIGIGDTEEEAFEEAKKYIMGHKVTS